MSAHRHAGVCALLCAAACLPLHGAELLATPGLQSPVRADPGGLIVLAGDQLSSAATLSLRVAGDARELPLEIVAAASTTHALIARLPEGFDAGRAARLTLTDPSGKIAIAVNDARPQWFAPASLPAERAPPGRERELRIVGRNLRSLGTAPRVVLRGPEVVELRAGAATTALADYQLRVALPALAAGDYQVALSADGREWLTLAPALRVNAPPPSTAVFLDEDRFGGCRADDMHDDTACVLAALDAARLAGGGTVYFGAGTWRLDDPALRERAGRDGLVVPRGVSLAGRGAERSRVQRGARWNRERAAPLFVLLGGNSVADLGFADAVADRTRSAPAFLRLGRSAVAERETPRTVEDLTVTRAAFSGSEESIDVGALPLRHVTVTHNLFRAWRLALAFGGNARNPRDRFLVEDALIEANRFEPGSYLDVHIGQGARAAEFGGALRLEFSDNDADGAALTGLDSDEDAPGWRAAFFWHLQAPQEQLLISGNRITCSGDKAGDGEAIALDSNHNSFAFAGARAVNAATRDTVTIAGPLLTRELAGMWVQVVAGAGLGQSRRIVAVDSAGEQTTLRVAPAFDIAPRSDGSRIVVARQFWQAYVIGNTIDHRRPPCRKSNRTGPRGGAISIWGTSSDSLVAGNRQYDSGGIVFQQSFARQSSIRQSFLEIRDNEIVGEYDARLPASRSGIQASHGAAADLEPPILGLGITIAGNHIDGASSDGAAISAPLTWYRGPAPYDWPLIEQLVIYGNRIENVAHAFGVAGNALLRDGVAAGNTCTAVRERTRLPEARLVMLCTAARETCECRGR